jgi:hypothetical protein
MTITVERRQQIAHRLRLGWSHNAIAADLGCTGSNITQLVHRYPELRRIHAEYGVTGVAQLRALREELEKVQLEVQAMSRQIRRLTRQLDEELEVVEAHLVA